MHIPHLAKKLRLIYIYHPTINNHQQLAQALGLKDRKNISHWIHGTYRAQNNTLPDIHRAAFMQLSGLSFSELTTDNIAEFEQYLHAQLLNPINQQCSALTPHSENIPDKWIDILKNIKFSLNYRLLINSIKLMILVGLSATLLYIMMQINQPSLVVDTWLREIPLPIHQQDISLNIHQVSLKKNTVRAGERIQIGAIVENIGNITVKNSFRIDHFLSKDAFFDPDQDIFLGSNRISDDILSKGFSKFKSSYIIIPTQQLMEEDIFLISVADYQNRLIETQKANNIVIQPITVINFDSKDSIGANLFIKNISYTVLSPTNRSSDQTVLVRITVANDGSIMSTDTLSTVYFTDMKINDVFELKYLTPFTQETIKRVGAYSTLASIIEVPTPKTLKNDTLYWLTVHLDNKNSLKELNEADNFVSIPFKIQSPLP